jgi:hypothetical protein
MQFSKMFLFRVFANGSFLIASAGPDDEGKYKCEASNNIGTALRRVVSLNVIGEISQHEKQHQNKTIYQREPTSET